jgi:hypothetical protein
MALRFEFDPPVFVGARVAHHFISVLCFVCVRLVSCETNVANVSGFSIVVCHLGFCNLSFEHPFTSNQVTRVFLVSIVAITAGYDLLIN